MKRTLSTNNRALARALELKKSELNTALNAITKLRAENHALHAKLNRIQGGTDVNSELFEKEVKARINVSNST